jgi:hypothetical protein
MQRCTVGSEHVASFMFWYKVWWSPAQISSHKPYTLSAFNVWVSICRLCMLTEYFWVKCDPLVHITCITKRFLHWPLRAYIYLQSSRLQCIYLLWWALLTNVCLLFTYRCILFFAISVLVAIPQLHNMDSQAWFWEITAWHVKIVSSEWYAECFPTWPSDLGLTFHLKHLAL